MATNGKNQATVQRISFNVTGHGHVLADRSCPWYFPAHSHSEDRSAGTPRQSVRQLERSEMPATALLVSLFSFSWPEADPPDPYRGLEPSAYAATRVGKLRDPNLREASGLAASRRNAGMLWSHNDSGWGPVLYAVGPAGEARGRVSVKNVTYDDWEDLASFELDGKAYLLIADVGDNAARRRYVWLHLVEEPQLDSDELEVKPAWSVAVRFPGGPADCEAVAVDAARGEVLLLTKREEPPRLFSVPLKPPADQLRIAHKATFLAELNTIPPPDATDLVDDPLFGPWRSQPTSMDLSDDGKNLVVLTYRHAYHYQRLEDESWAKTLSRAPQIVMLPKLRQSEALTFAADGEDIYVTTEKRPAPLFRLTPKPKRKKPGDDHP